MRPLLLSISAAACLATAGAAWADPGKDDRRAREPDRDHREVLLAQNDRRGYDRYRQSGYRGYTPLAPYPARIAPQPGRYDDYPAQHVSPYRNTRGPVPTGPPFARVEDWLGYEQDRYDYDYDYDYGYDPSPDLGRPYGTRPDFRGGRFASPTGGQITALADQLVGQAEAFLQAFLPQVGVVPQSEGFLADATNLRDSAIRFREVAFRGAPPAALAVEFQDVQASWQRFEARMARVSRGRIGPNIAEALQMGVTIEQIGQLMPY